MTMKKQLISFLLCFFMCVALFPISTQAAETTAANAPEIPTEGDVWDGSFTQPTKLVQKDGVYYYEITKCSELAYIAQADGNWLNANYILENNLIFNDVLIEWDENGELITLPDTLNKWIPIGNNSYSGFSGTFLGNGYLISGIYVDSSSACGLFKRLEENGIIDGITLVNSYVSGSSIIGGIVGTNSGGSIKNCTNYSCIYSSSSLSSQAGGICGSSLTTAYYFSHAIENCVNYGCVYAESGKVGGIVGMGNCDYILGCANYGQINSSGNDVGGIVGLASDVYTLKSVNYGTVNGNNNVGGIYGQAEGELYASSDGTMDCYNTGNVKGIDCVGGIIGNCLSWKLNYCYNLASIEGTSNVGAIVGYTDSLFGKSEERNNYYLEGCAVTGRGNMADSSNSVEKKSEAQLKDETNYNNWNFDTVWSMSADINDGYPYFQWQEGMLANIAVNAVTIKESEISLAEGDSTYLTAMVSPANASNKSFTWSSSASDIATVSAAGKVTAVSAGTAVITATTADGGYTASCTVTVTERLVDEYRINSITVRDNAGNTQSVIPIGNCLATVSITNMASEGNTLVLLAAYTSAGQHQGMMWVSVEDLPVGTTIKVTLPVNNTAGKIANLKAFTVNSFSNFTPLGEAVSFLP